jgi:GTP-binding protein
MLPVVAIVGRPNVGKSTLFNRLAGERKALVHDLPGVTRDRNYATISWLERSYLLIDTGGFDPTPEDALYAAMRRQSEAAMQEADVIVLLVDQQAGITPADVATANLIRTAQKPVIVAVNKCDEPSHEDAAHEFWQLGFSLLVPVSAEHGRGIYELMEAVGEHLPAEVEAPPEEEGEIRVAVLGRPNIGKSTLLNRLLGQERHVVHDMPGTTVDATDTVLTYDGTRFRLVDTAGIRRRSKIDERLETIAVSAAIRTIERCHVLLLVLDGAEGVTEQDAHLAALVGERRRGLAILVNKWDLVRESEDRDVKVIDEEIARRLPHVRYAPVLYISALTGKGTQRVLSVVRDVYREFDKRVATAPLNEFLRAAVAAYQPPQVNHHPVRINYITQVRVRPPTFTLFVNTPGGVGDQYQRYLENRMREQFGFMGSPLVLQVRRKRRLGEAAESGTGAPGAGADVDLDEEFDPSAFEDEGSGDEGLDGEE